MAAGVALSAIVSIHSLCAIRWCHVLVRHFIKLYCVHWNLDPTSAEKTDVLPAWSFVCHVSTMNLELC